MSRALFTAVSGLRNHQEWLDVIGNNIANANTTGFKASSVVFDDILGQTLTTGIAPTATTGGTNPMQIGLGVKVGSITPNFLQGSIQTTNRNTDLAIQGDGFFILSNGSDRVYTRAGAFNLDANGNLVDGDTGYKVLGSGGNIQISSGQTTGAVETSQAQFKGNLDYTVADGTSYVATFDIRDSVGAAHTLTLTFTKNFAGGGGAPGQWDWAVTDTDASISMLSGGAGVDGNIGTADDLAASGSVTFDANGAVSAGASKDIDIVYAAGAAVATPQTLTLDFGTAANLTPVTGLASASTVTLSNQDGQPAGTLQSFAIGLDGAITGFYSNGQSQNLGTVQLATFTNPTGLVKIGSNQFRESATSGTPNTGNPGTAGRGTLVAGALEQSNVDLAQEFTNMIIAERGFQANARTISTANQMLQELVNLKQG
jgi:flagellar hook protein FlgE